MRTGLQRQVSSCISTTTLHLTAACPALADGAGRQASSWGLQRAAAASVFSLCLRSGGAAHLRLLLQPAGRGRHAWWLVELKLYANKCKMEL